MPPRQKTETPDPVVETHIPDPAPSPDPQTGLVDPVEAQEHAQDVVDITPDPAEPIPEATPVRFDGIDPTAPHTHNYVTDYEFLPSCGCRVAFQICDICYTRL